MARRRGAARGVVRQTASSQSSRAGLHRRTAVSTKKAHLRGSHIVACDVRYLCPKDIGKPSQVRIGEGGVDGIREGVMHMRKKEMKNSHLNPLCSQLAIAAI